MARRCLMRKHIGLLLLCVGALVLAPALGCHSRRAPVARGTSGTARPLPPSTHAEVPFLGPSPRQVLSPIGIAVGDGGEVYLLDEATGFIKEFSPRGQPVREVRVAEPRSLAAGATVSQCLVRDHNGNLLVADAKRGVVRRLDAQGHEVGEIRVPADRSEPYNSIFVAPDSGGNVYVVTRPDNVARKYGSDGRLAWERALGETEPASPWVAAVAADPQDRLWVWLSESLTVLILEPDGRSPIRRATRSTGSRGEWGWIVAACFDRYGNRYELSFETVAGYGTDIAKFDPQGRELWVRNISAVEGTGLAVDSSGRAFVTLRDFKFTAATCVAFSPRGEETELIAPNGARPGEVRDPSGLAVGKAGDVYVGDYYTFRVQRFAPNGRFLEKIMGPDVAESPAQQIDTEGRLDSPASIAVGPDGLIYVTHGEPTISVFSQAGARVRSYPELSLGYAGGTDFHFGASPRYPAAIALDSAGHMWTAVGLEPEVVQTRGKPTRLRGGGVRVSEYDRAGRKLLSFGGYGTGPGQFGRSGYDKPGMDGISDSLLAVGGDGHVWVVDRYNNRVQQFDQEGRFLGQIGPKVGDLTLDHPWGVAAGGPGHLYIGDDRAILEFTPDGAFVGVVTALGGDRPYWASDLTYRYRALAVDASGNVHLSDSGMVAVRKFVPKERGSGPATRPATE
jgi:DNA-binding beta-propeller fold protein YncE